MPSSITVPEAARQAAIRALALEETEALPGTQGHKVAEALKSGSVDDAAIGRIRRFFATNEAALAQEQLALGSEADSPLLRSFLLYGAEAGASLVEDAEVEDDSVDALLKLSPAELKERLESGAWHTEYGLDVDGAARLVEAYLRATGEPVDFEIFGDSAEAVGSALYRRYNGADQYKDLAECLAIEDDDYRVAAQTDMVEMEFADRPELLDESMNWNQINKGSANAAAKLVWQGLVAYFILAVEKPELLKDLNAATKKPPKGTEELKPFRSYSDAVNVINTYFHPNGARYEDPAGLKGFNGVDVDMRALAMEAWQGKHMPGPSVKKILGTARRWTAQNKLAGSMFHVYLADWSKGNWDHILAAIPDDCDVRSAFAQFAATKALPAHGVKLQQTLSAKAAQDEMLAFVQSQFTGYNTLVQEKVGATQFGVAAAAAGTPVGVYSQIDFGGEWVIMGAVSVHGVTHIVLKDSDGTWTIKKDATLTNAVNNGGLTVLKAHHEMPGTTYSKPMVPGPMVKGSFDVTTKNLQSIPKDQSAAPKPTVSPHSVTTAKAPAITGAPSGPKFKAGDVVHNVAFNLYVMEVTTNLGKPAYRVHPIGLSEPPFVPYTTEASWLDLAGVLVASDVAFTGVWKYISPDAGGNTLVPIPDDWSVKGMDSVQYEGTKGLVVGAFKKHGVGLVYPILGTVATADGHPYLRLQALPADTFVVAKKSSYAPSVDKPEPSMFDETAPKDIDVLAPCGTAAAIEKAAKLQWTMAVKSESKAFQWDLGDVLQYGTKTRTIIGYAFNPAKTPIYVIKTETGAINFKTAVEGNKNYGPVINTDQAVLGGLKPKPGVDKTKYPKLNYKLSQKAIDFAKKTGALFVPSPPNPPFFVGAKVVFATGGKGTLIGWTKSATGETAFGVVLDPNGAPEFYLADFLAKNATLQYAYETKLDGENGIVTCGKGASSADVSVMTPGVTLPSALPDGWDTAPNLKEGVFEALAEGKHAAAGIVVIMPYGTTFESGGNVVSFSKCVMMVHPMNAFGGYELTFPKGTVDKGESMAAAAIREVYEETGLSVLPVAMLGDYKGNDSVTRFYIGQVTGGNPKKAGPETDAVTFRYFTLSEDLDHFATAGEVELSLKKASWFAKLAKRDQEVLIDAALWYLKNGAPGNAALDHGDQDSQVTMPQDTAPSLSYDPQAVFASETGTTDYPLSAPVKKFLNVENWENLKLAPAVHFLNKGYPPVGAVVKVDGLIGNLIVSAYAMSPVNAAGLTTAMLLAVHTDTPNGSVTKVPLFNTGNGKEFVVNGHDGFHPVTVQEVSKTVAAIPADATHDELWETLYKQMPFPMTTALVSAVKRALTAMKAPITKITGVKSHVGAPAYGTGFVDAAGKKFLAMGFVTVMYPSTDVGLQLAVDETGEAFALNGSPEWLALLKPDSGATEAFKSIEPWFTHPDAVVNKAIQLVYASGGDLTMPGVSMKTFKEKWLKEAGVPYYAVTSYTIVAAIAALFVPGAASKPQYDAVIGCLKKRMQLTQKKGKKAADQLPVATVSTAAPVIVSPPHYLSQGMADKTADTAIDGNLDIEHGISGGSKPNFIGTAKDGSKWFLKPKPSGDKTPFRPYTDLAAYLLCSQIVPSIPVAVTQLAGEAASIQPLLVGATPLNPHDYGGLSEADKGVVLAQHIADMFIGDHDGHFGNWMRGTDGHLYAIDKGQAFKFILTGVDEGMSPYWAAPGNFGVHVAKRLLCDWSEGKATIPKSAFASMWKAIKAVAALPDAYLTTVVNAWGKSAGYNLTNTAKVYTALLNRRDNWVSLWTSIMILLAKKRGETWSWGEPVEAPKRAPADVPKAKSEPVDVKPLTATAEKMGLTAKHAKTIAEAAAAKWQGKSIQVDKDAIENQEVLVKHVKYSSTDSPETSATLLQFRVSRAKGLKAEKVLNGKAKVVSGSAASGPQPLPFDNSGSGEKFWGIIQAGVKTINHHLFDAKDGKPNPETIKKVAQILPELKAMEAATKDPKGKFEGASNEAANLMATAYLGYCETLLNMAANAEKLIGQKTETMYQFLWQEKVTKPEEEEPVEEVSIKKLIKAGFHPSSSPIGTEVAVKGTDAPLFEPYSGGSGKSKQTQFMIELKSVPGARLYFCPPHSEGTSYSGVRAHYGQAWAIVPGTPSPATVSLIMHAFEKATGLDMRVASADDNEVLYLSKQMYSLQDTGDGVSPDSNGEAVKDPAYKAALAKYAEGKTDAALADLRVLVASKMGTTPAALVKDPTYNPAPQYNRGAGYARHSRLGWTRSKLASLFGSPDVFFVHAITGKTLTSFFQVATAHNGALIANAVKPYFGIPIGGTGSPDADFASGGAAVIFGCMRNGFQSQSGLLYFDLSLFLRTDVYVIGQHDSFGSDTATRYTNPETWKKHGLNKSKGSVGLGSSWQFTAKHEIDLQQYLHTVILESVADRDAVRKLCKDAGWTSFANGRSLEQVVVLRGEEKS